MKYYIKVDENGIITSVAEVRGRSGVKSSGFVEISETLYQDAVPGKKYIDGVISDADPTPELKISIDKLILAADGSDTATISIRLEVDGQLTNYADGIEYNVPLVKVPTYPYDLLSVTLTGGEASVEFKTTEKGIYTVVINEMEPKPHAILIGNPKIIAK